MPVIRQSESDPRVPSAAADIEAMTGGHDPQTWKCPIEVLFCNRVDVTGGYVKWVVSPSSTVSARPLLWQGALGTGPAGGAHADAEVVLTVAGVAASGTGHIASRVRFCGDGFLRSFRMRTRTETCKV